MNVIRLRQNTEVVHSEPKTRIAVGMTGLLASNAKLGQAVQGLSKQFDVIENAIETIEDPETRYRLKQSIRLSRETLSKAVLKLTQQIGKVVDCHGL